MSVEQNSQSAIGVSLLTAQPAHVPNERVIDFDIYNPPGVSEGEKLHDAWKFLHKPGSPDVVWTPRNGGHWIFTRYGSIGKAFLDPEHFSSKIMFVPRSQGEQYKFIPVTTDPPDHTQFRAVVNAAIGPRVMARLQHDIEKAAVSLVEALAPRGQCNFVKDFAEPFPFRILLRLLDLPQEDAGQLKKLADQITRPDGSMTMTQATQNFNDYLKPFIEQRRISPGEDAISKMVEGKVNGRPVTVSEAQNMVSLVLFAGLDTVVNFSSFSIQFLAGSPQHRKELLANPELIPQAREELLRRFSVAAVARYVNKDITVDGVDLKEGEMVLLPSVLPGLDDRQHDDPMTVDFHRERQAHMTFGYGPHVCAGAALARREVDAFLKAWLERIPEFEIAPGAKVMHLGGIVGAVQEVPLVWDVATTRTVRQ